MAINYKLVAKLNPLNRDLPVKYYAKAIIDKSISLKKLARELAARSTTASEGDVYSVLIGMRDLMKEHLERSDKVIIDGIGSFQASLSSEGAETEEMFNQSLIKKAKILYQEDSEMKNFTGSLKYTKIK